MISMQQPSLLYLHMFERSDTEFNGQASLLAESQVVFSFTCDPNDVLDAFEENSRTASNSSKMGKPQKKQSLMSMINCLSWWHVEGVTAVKLTLSTQTERDSLKQNCVAEVKGLAGNPLQIQHFLQTFIQRMCQQKFGMTPPKIMMEGQNESINLVQNQNPYYLQVCSHHLISKLVLSEQHSLGDSLTKMVSDFRDSFKNVGESIGLLPLPMKNAMSIANDLGEQLTKLLIQLKYPKEILSFSRISVEQLVFSRVEDQLFAIYRCKHMQAEVQFQRKRHRIFQTYTLREILTEVCLHQKYWSLNPQKLDCILSLPEAKTEIYFTAVCRQLEKIVFTCSPREKIKYCQLAYTQLKTHFFDYSQHKYELSSMEDIIPVLIVVVLLLDVAELRAEFDLMIDYISFENREMEAEKRLLINFSESYNYIARDWKLAH